MEKEGQTGVVVRVLAYPSLAKTVLFVCWGVAGGLGEEVLHFAKARHEHVTEKLLAALVFSKQRKLLPLLEVVCLSTEFVIA